MNIKSLLIVFVLFIGIASNAQDVNKCKAINKNTIRQFQNNHSDSVFSYFNDDMRSKLSAADLAKIWSQLESAMGKFNGVGEAKGMQFEAYYQLETQLQFEKKNLRYRLAFDKDNRISGMYFVPYKTRRTPALKMANTDKYREMPVKVHTSDLDLPGTLCIPKNVNNFPIIVFVHGSGPNDRDETIGPNKPFRDIAHGLSELGIASIRYDKRSLVNPSTLMDIGDKSMLDAVVTDDALAAVELAKTIQNIDSNKVFVLGHSLGAMMAPRIAQKNPEIKGIIMMAGNARPLEDLVYDQYKYIYNQDGLSKTEKAKLRQIAKEVKNVKHLESLLAKGERVELPITSDVRFWKAINDYNQLETAKAIPQPMLIMQGLRDYQVTPREFKLWQHRLHKKNNVSFKSYAKLNHLFLEGEGKSYPKEYETKGNVPQYVISDIATWVKILQ
jgi:dienelactone hydrolase